MLRDLYLQQSTGHAVRKMQVTGSEELQVRVITGSWADKHAVLLRPASST
jgi:hypothetical protein